MPAFYKRYVDDTLSKMPDVSSASEFLSTLNEIHPSVSFTMELEDNGKLPLTFTPHHDNSFIAHAHIHEL